jgi:hypothetical protein
MTKDSQAPYSALDAKLAEFVAQAASPPGWYERWRNLGPAATDEDRLAVFQAIRDAGELPPEAGFHLVAWQIDLLTAAATTVELEHFYQRLQSLRLEHGLFPDEEWPAGQEPPAYHELNRRFAAAWDNIFARKLKQHGEHKMARLFLADRPEFDRQWELGRRFFGESADTGEDESSQWLQVLHDIVDDCIEVDGAAGPLAVRWGQDGNCWQVAIYPTPVELVGGAEDGEVVVPGFTLDLERLRGAFTRLDGFGWNALGLHEPEGPYVYLEGDFLGHEVFLRILAQAPTDEQPGTKLRV